MRKLSDLKDYQGTDASNEISLFEYGLLGKESDEGIHCYYGVRANEDGNYDRFQSGAITKEEVDKIINENWFDKYSFFQFLGMEEKDWIVCAHYVGKISDLLSYYGHENIFGSYYDEPFEIEND